MKPRRQHAFTDVDATSDPTAWVEVLDAVRREPLYAAYKRRIVELLDPRPDGRYLEVGTGTGSDALAFAERFGASVAGVDSLERDDRGGAAARARRRGRGRRACPALRPGDVRRRLGRPHLPAPRRPGRSARRARAGDEAGRQDRRRRPRLRHAGRRRPRPGARAPRAPLPRRLLAAERDARAPARAPVRAGRARRRTGRGLPDRPARPDGARQRARPARLGDVRARAGADRGGAKSASGSRRSTRPPPKAGSSTRSRSSPRPGESPSSPPRRPPSRGRRSR